VSLVAIPDMAKMKLLVPEEDIWKPKCNDKVKCLCYQCNKEFEVTKNLARRGLIGQKSVKFCSRKCSGIFHAVIFVETECRGCRGVFSINKNLTKKQKFCSRQCCAKYYNKQRRKFKNCLNCNHPIPSWGKTSCSKKCWREYSEKQKLEKWLNEDKIFTSHIPTFIKKYLLSIHNKSCSECGWNKINGSTNKCPLQIHHIDGDARNNTKNNLQLLCPNCHSLTLNFGAKNKKSSRTSRYVC
jgi:hypothetical protein